MMQHAQLTWSVTLERDGTPMIVRVAAATRDELASTVIAAQRETHPQAEIRITGARLIG
jgi:hypothetical protein